MKTYIFLTPHIGRVGGAQLYVCRKSEYLIQNGWTVFIFYYLDGQIRIDYPSTCMLFRILALENPPEALTKHKLGHTINEIIDHISSGNERVVVESHTRDLLLWGELISQKLNGINLCYLLSEKFTRITDNIKSFLRFKLNQGLLYGIAPKSITQIFTDLPLDKSPYLLAYGCSSNNVVETQNYILDNAVKCDWNILSIGRLEKEYIIPSFKSIVNLAEKHPEKSISVIVIGGAYRQADHDNAIGILKQAPNIRIYDVGYIWPIPLSSFKLADVAIASAGSVAVASEEGVPTISIDANDCKPIGIFGISTSNSLNRSVHEPQLDLVELLEDVLSNGVDMEELHRNCKKRSVDYSSHMMAINKQNVTYYDVLSTKMFRHAKLILLLKRILGHRLFYAIISKLRALINTI